MSMSVPKLHYEQLSKEPFDIKAQGQTIFMEKACKAEYIPFATLELRFLDLYRLVKEGKETETEVGLMILANQHAEQGIPRTIKGWIEITEGSGGLLVDEPDASNKTDDAKKEEFKQKCEFEFSGFTGRHYLQFKYKDNPQNQAVKIEAFLDIDTPYINSPMFIETNSGLNNPEGNIIYGRFGKYEIIKEFWRPEGASAKIFLAKNKDNDTECVIKKLNNNWETDSLKEKKEKKKQKISNIFSINQEGKLLLEYDSPYIVQGLDLFTIDDERYIVMEYLKGMTLLEFIQENYQQNFLFDMKADDFEKFLKDKKIIPEMHQRFSDEGYPLAPDVYIVERKNISNYWLLYNGTKENQKVFHIEQKEDRLVVSSLKYRVEDANQIILYFYQIIQALETLHLNNQYHRDIKPENIMLIEDEGQRRAVLFDFGIIKTTTTVIEEDNLLGTYIFLPPEYLLGRHPKYSEHSDIYSLASVMSLALSGHHPQTFELFPFYSYTGDEHAAIRKSNLRNPNYRFPRWYLCNTVDLDINISGFEDTIKEYLHDILVAMLAYNYEDRMRLEELDTCLFYISQHLEGLDQSIYEKWEQEQDIPILGPNRCLLKKIGKLQKDSGSDLVWQVLNTKTNKRYVVKFINPKVFNQGTDEESCNERIKFYQRFKLQYRILSKFYSQHIPKLVFTCFDPETTYLIMEYASGKSASELVQKGQLDQYRILSAIKDIASLLVTLHKYRLERINERRWLIFTRIRYAGKVFHRNIEPDNIYIDIANIFNTTLLGFGAVKDAKEGVVNYGTSMNHIVTNTFFLAPEVHLTEPYTIKSEIFSLGICLHVILTAKHPFITKYDKFFPVEQYDCAFSQSYRGTITNKVPANIAVKDKKLRNLLKDMLELDPAKRPEPEEVCQRLATFQKKKNWWKFF